MREPSLTPEGIAQVGIAARLIKEAGLHPDLLVTSPMLRAHQTIDALTHLLPLEHLRAIETVTTWRLAERDYGCLTGLSKAECRRRYVESGRFGFTGPEIVAMLDALDAYEAIEQASSDLQMEQAWNTAKRSLELQKGNV